MKSQTQTHKLFPSLAYRDPRMCMEILICYISHMGIKILTWENFPYAYGVVIEQSPYAYGHCTNPHMHMHTEIAIMIPVCIQGSRTIPVCIQVLVNPRMHMGIVIDKISVCIWGSLDVYGDPVGQKENFTFYKFFIFKSCVKYSDSTWFKTFYITFILTINYYISHPI